jgi:TonB family protein
VRRSTRVAIVFAGCLAIAAPVWARQETTLARAKEYYASAAYEEALDILRRLNGISPPAETREIAVYQLFCLLALGRVDETKKTIETIVRADPMYHLSEEDASPRVRTLFEETRRPLLPGIIKDLYAQAKAAYDRKETAEAVDGFDRVLALVADGGLTDAPGIGDINTLATGFRDLLRVPANSPAAAPPPAPKPDPTTPPAAPAAKTDPRIYGPDDAAVVRAVPISNALPAWRPTGLDARQEFRGDLELVIDETGAVSSAVVRKPIHRVYDQLVVEAAKRWKFHPATLNGQPVKYRYVLEVNLKPGGER